MEHTGQLRIAALALLLCVCPLLAQSAVPAGKPIDEVEVVGNQNLTTTYIRSLIQIAPGDPYDPAVVQAEVRRLLRTRKFLAVDAEVVQRGQQVVAVFTVAERPTVSEIRIAGNQEIKDKDLLERVPLRKGDPIDAFDAREGADSIIAAYREKGYSNVNVDYDAELLQRTGELVYTVEEGPRLRIRKIVYEGNASLTERELNKQIESKTYLWLLRDGDFDSDQVEQDAAALQNHYRGLGWLDARVGYRVEPRERPEDLTLVFLVDEGTRYIVESVEITGNSVFPGAALEPELRTRVGEYLRQVDLERDVRDLKRKYGEIGYIYADAVSGRVFSESPGLVRVRIEISEGDQYRVGRVVVRGNQSTKDKVVRRSLDLAPPDDLIDVTELEDAERKLRETQIFSFARVSPVGDQEGVRDLVIDVEESERAGDFIFGVGVNSNSGVVGNLVLDIRNFDLYDVPRSFTEFIKLRSFRGAGQRLRLEAQPGTEYNRFRIDFEEPYFLDHPIRFGTSLYYFDRNRERHDESRIGANVSFGKRLPDGLLKDWYVEVAGRVENVRIDNLELWAPEDVKDVEGNNALTSVKFTLVRDRTDSRWVPSTGDTLRVSWEQFGVLGGDHFFSKVLGSYTRHYTVFEDANERKHVLSLRGDVGGILGSSPTFERFYAGGIGSIRGFEFRSVSPRDGLKDTVVGGDFLLLAKAEYSFPLFEDVIRGLVFTDMGTVEEEFEISGWRASVGVGVRLQIEFFGPVPLEFDLAIPVTTEADDEEQVFSFFIGALF